ncbi:MAG TPA: class I SAM-dependent methyltransferase [Bacilli bacterium]
MELSPLLYHWFIRPRWFTKKYIHDHITNHFHVENKIVLDFGAGTGANCCLFAPSHYLGIDLDEKRINFAKQLYPKHRFIAFDGHRIPIPNQTVDCILIVAVLHHISTDQISEYLEDFRRILKPQGNIIVIEPYVCEKTKVNNWFMNWYDNGQYIRKEDEYLKLFKGQRYECNVLKKFKKCVLYNEILFNASPEMF